MNAKNKSFLDIFSQLMNKISNVIASCMLHRSADAFQHKREFMTDQK
jgi:hypothetical protein